jgi:hypothetical protein
MSINFENIREVTFAIIPPQVQEMYEFPVSFRRVTGTCIADTADICQALKLQSGASYLRSSKLHQESLQYMWCPPTEGS